MDQKKVKVWGVKVSTLGLEETIEWIGRNNGTVYCCTLNEVMMADKDVKFRKILSRGNLLTADGMPLVLMARLKTGRGERVYGPELMGKLLFANDELGIKQVLIGDEKNRQYFEKFGKYINLPHKDEFAESDYLRMVKEIKKSQARLVWVGLGAKKQIVVADELSKRLPDRVLVTVGAAFDFISGNKKQAPKWLRRAGGEWLFRLICEPKRLARRYGEIVLFVILKMVKSIVFNRFGHKTGLLK